MSLDLSIKILIVDDYQTMIKIISNLLKQVGLENIDSANNGEQAMQKLKESSYDLVISDWNMKPMSGYELLQQIRSDDSLTSLPFIMITAESKTQNVIAAKKAGVNNYIIKPFNSQTLLGKIQSVFS